MSGKERSRDEKNITSGKLLPDELERAVLSKVGAPRGEVLVGPRVGEDAAVIKWPDGRLMVLASDPIVGAEKGGGRLLVRVNVNDIAAKGAEPAFIIITIIMPPHMGERAVAAVMSEINDECAANNIAIVGGHTEFNDAYRRPVMCAALVGMTDRVLSAADISNGDAIYVSKHIGIEGMAILASDRPDLLRGHFSESELREIEEWMELTSVLPESRMLRDFASFMHDPTEGGFMGGLHEICALAGMSAELTGGAVPLHPYTIRASEAIGFDPLRLVASGSMIAIVPKDKTASVEERFANSPIKITKVGVMNGSALPDKNRGSHEELWGLLKRKRTA
ncbi:hydrogenase expression protein [Synergistales bacterium]|nr:hydrogenase expression protein [Synergistales bacterium]